MPTVQIRYSKTGITTPRPEDRFASSQWTKIMTPLKFSISTATSENSISPLGRVAVRAHRAPEHWSIPLDNVEIDDFGYAHVDLHEPSERDLTLDDFLNHGDEY